LAGFARRDYAIADSNRFARFGFGVAGSRTRISIFPIPLLRWSRTYHSRLQTPSADGRKRPLHGNTQAHPFDILPRRSNANVVHTMYRFCYRRIVACLRKSTDGVLALIVPRKWGLVVDSGERRWSERTKRYEIAWADGFLRNVALKFIHKARRRAAPVAGRAEVSNARWRRRQWRPERTKERQLQAWSIYRGGRRHTPLAPGGHSNVP
jgi:hypothetical protein